MTAAKHKAPPGGKPGGAKRKSKRLRRSKAVGPLPQDWTVEPVQWTDRSSFTAARLAWQEDMFLDPLLTGTQKVILARLHPFTNWHTGLAFPHQGTLAELVRQKERAVRMALKVGELRGWLRSKRIRTGKVYALSVCPQLLESLHGEKPAGNTDRHQDAGSDWHPDAGPDWHPDAGRTHEGNTESESDSSWPSKRGGSQDGEESVTRTRGPEAADPFAIDQDSFADALPGPGLDELIRWFRSHGVDVRELAA